jgi:threonylcarbamoyladenosine tRNA methylthiotransferase MtaB
MLRETLNRWGMTEAESAAAPELIVVNTCTVTGMADAKVRKTLRKARREHPTALIAVTGCFAQLTNQAAPPPAGADIVFSPKNLAPIAEFLRQKNILNGVSWSEHATQSYFAEHTRAFLKIQDGCDCFCSYCIVPFVRPTLWSRRPEEVIAAINGLSERGYKEVVLTGIHLGFYGRERRDGDGSHATLAALLAKIETNCGINRVRLSSIEVNEASDELVNLMARSSMICRHLHLPLQSGDNDILKRMNRRYSADSFLNRVNDIRKKIPDIGLTTDIIVGFPGETEEQFERTCEAVESIEFAKVHVFRYSSRPGTRAAEFDAPVPPNVASERARRLIRVGNAAAIRYKRAFIGKTLDALVETYDGKRKRCEGLTPNYLRVRADGALKECVNTILPVTITGVDADTGLTIGRI